MAVVGALTTAEGISLAIAALALVLGVWNAVRDVLLRRKIAAKERQANVTIALESKAGSDRLVLFNAGPAAARHVHVLIGGASLLHHAWFQGEHEISGPLGAHAPYPYDVDWQATEPTEVVVTWADDSAKEREYRTTIQPGPGPVTFYAFEG